jgi:hypothetical protein
MAKNNHAFTIDDALGTSDNLAVYAQVLEAIDAPLGAALRPYLASLAAGQPVDTATIWDALYAATAPADPDLPHAGGGAVGAEGAA